MPDEEQMRLYFNYFKRIQIIAGMWEEMQYSEVLVSRLLYMYVKIKDQGLMTDSDEALLVNGD